MRPSSVVNSSARFFRPLATKLLTAQFKENDFGKPECHGSNSPCLKQINQLINKYRTVGELKGLLESKSELNNGLGTGLIMSRHGTISVIFGHS